MRKWWGKIIGAIIGTALGGFFLGIIGFVIGHVVDTITSQMDVLNLRSWTRETSKEAKNSFFETTFSVMGHISKSDGRVTDEEIQLANKVMEQLQLDDSVRTVARELFRKGKSQNFPLTQTLIQFRRQCPNLNLRRIFIEIQIKAALADRRMDPAENKILFEAASVLGFNRRSLELLIRTASAEFRAYERYNQSSAFDATDGLDECYEILGVSKTASKSEIKRAYRKRMSQNHPDKLASKGLPDEMIKMATEKTSRIQRAYQQIKEVRGIK